MLLFAQNSYNVHFPFKAALLQETPLSGLLYAICIFAIFSMIEVFFHGALRSPLLYSPHSSSLLGVFCLYHHYYIYCYFSQDHDLLVPFISNCSPVGEHTNCLTTVYWTEVNQSGQTVKRVFILVVNFVCNPHLSSISMLLMIRDLIVKMLDKNQDHVVYLLVISVSHTIS